MSRPAVHPRLAPRPSDTNYLVLKTLAAQMRAQIRRHVADRPVDVLDVGCGTRPYQELLAPVARRYVGVDLQPGTLVDVVGAAEALPIDDRSFDVVLCNQVLEHSTSPESVVSEASRVLRPRGLALISTHGVVRYHPAPDDYWRWTHAGLSRLVTGAGSWSRVDVMPNGGTASALAFLTTRELDILAGRLGIARALRPVVLLANVLAWRLDLQYRRRFPDRPPDLAANYLVSAVRSTSS